MRTRTTNRLRSTLDVLEARDVPVTLTEVNAIADVLPAIPDPSCGLPTIVGAGRLGPITTAPKPAPVLQTADSVITLRNGTARALRFTVQWEGREAAETFVLRPGQVKQVRYQEVGVFPVGRPATVQVDAGRGRPIAVFQATAGLVPDGSAGTGRVYTVRMMRGELAMVPNPGLPHRPVPVADRVG